MGSSEHSVPVLEALLAAGVQVAGVYCQPDKPAGRGRAPRAPAVKTFARDRGIDVYQPTSLRQEAVRREMESLQPEVAVVAAYGKILPRMSWMSPSTAASTSTRPFYPGTGVLLPCPRRFSGATG